MPLAARSRLALSVALSIALHILLVLFLIPNASKGLSAGGSGGDVSGAGEGMVVTLYQVDRVAAGALQVKPQDPVEDAVEPLAALATDSTLTADTSPVLPQLPQTAVIAQAADVATDGTIKVTQVGSVGGVGQSGTTSGSDDDLWNAIAPCWKRMAGTDTLPATLTVSFTAQGLLVRPPVIKRDSGTQNTDQQLQSETVAIQALTACGLYPMAANRENVTVSFPKP